MMECPSLIRGASPLGLPYTLSRAPRRRRAPVAWLARHPRSHFGTSIGLMRQLLVTAGPLVRYISLLRGEIRMMMDMLGNSSILGLLGLLVSLATVSMAAAY